MTILQYKKNSVGLAGVLPQFNYIHVDNTLSQLTTPGFLKPDFFVDSSVDNMFLIKYSTGIGLFSATVTDGVVTLSQNNSDVILPTTANYAAAFADDEGTLKNGAATLTNPGNINAGLSGTAGTLKSFPSTASKGSFEIKAVANAGNTTTTLSNAAMNQAVDLTIPDPLTATANMVVSPAALVAANLIKASGTAGLVVDAGFNIISGTTGTYAGGGTSTIFAISGVTSSSRCACVIRTSTNSVSITKVLPDADQITVTFSADPGAGTTVDYVITTVATSP